MAANMNIDNGVAALVQEVEKATELELVRRGFDPAQVQNLVGSLAGELKNLATENERLKARVVELEQAPRPAADTDIFSMWSNETNALLDAARMSISRVTEQATHDAASAVSAGEVAATAIRQRAQIDAEQLLADARRQAEASLAEARQQSEQALAQARQQSAQTLAEAEARKAALAGESQAQLVAAATQLAATESKVNDLKAQRSAIRDQLTTAQTHIMQLLSLVHAGDDSDETPAATAAEQPVDTGVTTGGETADDHS